MLKKRIEDESVCCDEAKGTCEPCTFEESIETEED